MKLASKQDVLTLLSLRTTTQSTDAIDVALETATVEAASILGTDFEFKTRIDQFRVTREVDRILWSGSDYQFFLTDGFLPDDIGKVYATSDTILNTATATVVDKSSYLIEGEHGVLLLAGRPVSNLRTVGIQYNCGFEVDSDGVYQNVPQWLQQAAITATIETLRSHSITTNKKDNLTDMTNALTRSLRTQLYAHVRPRYNGLFPRHTRVI